MEEPSKKGTVLPGVIVRKKILGSSSIVSDLRHYIYYTDCVLKNFFVTFSCGGPNA